MEEIHAAEVQRVVFTVVAVYRKLPPNLFLRSLQLMLCKWGITELIKLTVNKPQTAFYVLFIASKIGAPQASITVCDHRTLHRIDESTVLTQHHIEACIHPSAAKNIIEQIETHALPKLCIATTKASAANHDMCLMGIFLANDNIISGRLRHIVKDSR